ncbi:hypothetical protein CN424_15180 [Bacillus cereus]|nr:hypothetical protein CN424_15180 [Bacillus cereus]
MKKIILKLIGLAFTFKVAIYIALCPILNQGNPLTILVVWEQAKYQILGLFIISIVLLLVLILQYHVQILCDEYYRWLLIQMVIHYFEKHIYHVAA